MRLDERRQWRQEDEHEQGDRDDQADDRRVAQEPVVHPHRDEQDGRPGDRPHELGRDRVDDAPVARERGLDARRAEDHEDAERRQGDGREEQDVVGLMALTLRALDDATRNAVAGRIAVLDSRRASGVRPPGPCPEAKTAAPSAPPGSERSGPGQDRRASDPGTAGR